MSNQPVMIIDGDINARDTVELSLLRMGVDTLVASTLEEALEEIATYSPVLCLANMVLPNSTGIDVIRAMSEQTPPVPVAIFSELSDTKTIVSTMKAGAFDYTLKPVETAWLRDVLQATSQTEQASSKPKNKPQVDEDNSRILGNSSVMQKLKATITKLARSQAPIFIQGESGSGKELVAHEIHAKSAQANAPFIPVNCGAIPENLVESEFFGHKKGSFTGASTDKQGLFQAANGGTLFLDEVADLPLDMQVKLLRAIQEQAVKPVGGLEEIPVNVRILSATHKSLEGLVETGQFRQDLYYRLNVIQLDVPPLRERQDDILLLTDFFLQNITQRWHMPLVQLTQDARAALLDYEFPGNVRELENILERATTLCDEDTIDVSDLGLRKPSQNKITKHAPEHPPLSVMDTSEEKEDIPDDVWNPEDADAEKDLVKRALEYTRWNRTRAARILGMTFRQLSYRIQKYSLDEENP
jgi:two-component system response regulator PilR (NtrC family)